MALMFAHMNDEDQAGATPPTGPTDAERIAAARAEIAAAMDARGWMQPRLAREAGVSLRTVNRILTGTDYTEPRSMKDLQRVLGLGEFAGLSGPPLRLATAEELAEELLRRLKDGEGGVGNPRIVRGTLPDDVLDSPDVRTSPPRRSPRKRRQEG